MTFDIKRFTAAYNSRDRYDRHVAQLDLDGKDTSAIRATTDETLKNIVHDRVRSFVIYGEPQSGKTAMMIALTARLLDNGFKIVIVLVNDNVQLLKQNLDRFIEAGLEPSPRNFSEVLDNEISLQHGEWIIFCKKNPNDLRKLIAKIGRTTQSLVVIDDEADYATPNGKINKGEQTTINELVEKLIGERGVYVGVTATPARLNLNNTFDNDAERWVLFQPHPEYVGHTTFFPVTTNGGRKFELKTFTDNQGDTSSHLRDALFRFIVNVAYLNAVVDKHRAEQNYCMLVHTSGNRADHTVDYKNILKTMKVLMTPDAENPTFQRYFKQIQKIATERYPGAVDEILAYIAANIRRQRLVVMNSAPNKATVDYEHATSPKAPFTIAIGGNIVSRGVTFNNLLSMFFTRDVRHKIQQDTYIQRARMFGSRNRYLKYFELCIPDSLYDDWHKCFVYHNLALESIKTRDISPVWLEDKRIAAAAPASINRATVNMDKGEMSFDIFDYSEKVANICNGSGDPMKRLEQLQALVGTGSLPPYLLEFMKAFPGKTKGEIAIHSPFSIANYKSADTDKANIARKRGFIGQSDLELNRFPNAVHHIKVYHNGKGKARVFYKYTGGIRFLKNMKGS